MGTSWHISTGLSANLAWNRASDGALLVDDFFFWRNYVTLASPAILSQHSTAVNSRLLMADVGILGKVELGSHAIEW